MSEEQNHPDGDLNDPAAPSSTGTGQSGVLKLLEVIITGG
jgi:hypothetical protein